MPSYFNYYLCSYLIFVTLDDAQKMEVSGKASRGDDAEVTYM